jgi:hypothetical protein
MTAFIDESHQRRPDHYDFYTMTAAIVDYRPSLKASRQTVIESFHDIASQLPPDRHGRHSIHANRMRNAYDNELEAVQRSIAASEAVRMIMTVRTRTADVRNDEDARQTCLADLTTRLTSLGNVSRLIMDSRDDLARRGMHQTRKPEPGGGNAIDRATITDLQRTKQAPAALDVVFADDTWADQLWLADVASYVVARSIARRDPGYMSILAAKIEIHEAIVLPVAVRRLGQTQLEPTGLELALQDHWSIANAIRLGLPVPEPMVADVQEPSDQPPRPRMDDGASVDAPTLLEVMINPTVSVRLPSWRL